MPDQRSVMKEYRHLDEKRVAEGLTPEEESRYARLRDLVAPEPSAAPRPTAGFDVQAAADRLRDSLVPAGVRTRTSEPSPDAAPDPAQRMSAADALASVYSEPPFELSEPLAPEADGALEGWQPAGATAAPPYDAGGQPYDAAALPYDPNAQTFDPAQQPYDPGAAYDPDAGYEAAAAQPYDPNAPALDPAALPLPPDPLAYGPGAQGYDLNAAAWTDASLQETPPSADAAPVGWDADAPWDASAYPQDPAAPPGYDPNVPYDPGAQPDPAAVQAGWVATSPSDPPADAAAAPLADPVAPVYEPPSLDELTPGLAGLDLSAAPQAPLDADLAPLPPAGWEASPPPPEPSATEVPLGEYDEIGGGAIAPNLGGPEALPFDAAETTLVYPGDAALEVPESHGAALGEYDDTAGFGGGTEPTAVPDDAAGWMPEAALDEGFELASPGSFGAANEAAVPEWAGGVAAPPWESAPVEAAPPEEPPLAPDALPLEVAPALEAERLGDFGPPRTDLGADQAAFVDSAAAPAADPLEIAVDESAREPFAGAGPEYSSTAASDAAPAAEPTLEFAVDAVEEIPTVDGADILEDLPEESPAPPPRSLDFEPLVRPATARDPEPAPPPSAPVAAAPEIAPPAPPSLPAQPFAVPAEPVAPPVAPPPERERPFHVAGAHRVVVHTVEGQVKRGALQDVDLGSDSLALAAQAGGAIETVPTDKVKAIFFMLSPGEKAPPPEGKKVRVTFRDGRQVAGFSPDYDEAGIGFFMIPGDTRTNTGRIWVYRSAVRQVAVS